MRRNIIAGLALGALGLAAGGVATSGARAQRGMGSMTAYPYASGEDIYAHVCQGCHMPDAKGAMGAAVYGYPALAGNPKLAANVYPAAVIVNGQKAMPAFAELSDEQVAAVVNYVRTHFGNSYGDAVTAADVKELRPAAATGENKRPG